MTEQIDVSARLDSAADRAEQAADILHAVANGGPAAEVPTNNGPVPSVAKWLADHEAAFTAQAEAVLGPVTEQAGIAVGAAEAASADAGRAETAAEAAIATGKVYADTASGLAATASGQYFSVPSAESVEYLVLYQNSSGVAVEKKRYPSFEAVTKAAHMARRANYQLLGRPTKVAKIGATYDFSVSWGRLYLFAATGQVVIKVQAVTDLTVPDGMCAYIDLSEAQVEGEYQVHVSALSLSDPVNPAGSYIEDSKIILFTCLFGIVGGAIYPQYHAVGSGVVTRDALDASIKNIIDRGGWHVSGKATKLQPLVSTPTTYQISFPELTISGSQTFSSKLVAPVTNVSVPMGEAIYVDLDGAPNVSGQLEAQVTSGGYTAGMQSSGAFVVDRKVYLFINDVRGIGGPLAQQQISVDFIDQTLKNRTNRSAYVVIGDLTRFLLNGSTCVLAFNDLRVTRGVGNTSLTVAAAADISVPQGQALFVDLSAELVNGKLVAQVTTGGYSSNAGNISNGAFVDDNKLYLFVNDTCGHGGVLAARKPNNIYLGDVWLKQSPINITFDPATRTLTWDNYLILPANGGQARIKLAPGSYTFSNQGFNVAYLDLGAAVTTGDTPATAIKGGQYYDAANADRFRGLPHQMPIFYWNSATDYGPLGGFPVVGAAPSGGLQDDDIIVKVSAELVSIFVKGSKSGSSKYLEFTIGHESKPFDPSGADAYGNSDLWRLKHAYECDITPGTTSFTRTRSGSALLNGGEIECAIKEQGAVDYIGGFHGDEVKTHVELLLDGVEIAVDTPATLIGKKLQFVQRAKLYKCNTQIEVAEHAKRVTISRAEGSATIRLQQHVKWSQSLVIEAAMLTMLPIKRLLNDTSGEQITSVAMRAPFFDKEDVAAAGFGQVTTVGSLPIAQTWGPTGISAEVEVLTHPSYADCGFYVANAIYYNKFYYSVAGSAVSTMGGTTHTTQPGEAWDVDSVIKMTTNL